MSAVVKTRLSGIIVAALGIIAAVLARRLPAQSGFGLGPAFLPFWTGLILAACGLWILVRPGSTAAPTTATAFGRRGRAAAGFFILVFYVLVLEPLGYLLSTIGFLVATTLVLSPNRFGRALSVGIGGALFLLLIFRLWLRVPLPGGAIGW